MIDPKDPKLGNLIIEFEVSLIEHLAKKKKISKEEAAKWFAGHWAKILRKHIEEIEQKGGK